jgi:hypothetical protein
MLIFINRAARMACASLMHERVSTGTKQGTSWEDIMDNMRGVLGTYVKEHTMCLLKDDMMILNAYLYGAPDIHYKFNKLGRYVRVMSHRYVYVNGERYAPSTASDLLGLLCPGCPSSFKEACMSWLLAVHSIAPDMHIEEYYLAYMRVLRWLYTGKGTRPTTWDMDMTYRMLMSEY